MSVAARLAALMTRKRVMTWGAGLLAVSWFIHLHTMAVPGLVDRIGRFKGTDYIQFYVMGSMVLDGRTDALYDPHAHLEEGRRRIDPDLQFYAVHPNYGPQIALAFVAFRRRRPFVAGLVIGCLAYKPQLGIVLGVALLASRQWRVLIGAATTGIGQLGVAWLTAGAPVLGQYFAELWTLAR